MRKLKRIEEQVAVVMGASSGIGRETALRLAGRGARVVAAARTESALASLVAEIRANGGTAEYLVADTTDSDQVNSVARYAVERYDRIDTWIQAAGVAMWSRFEEMRPEEWSRIIDVNLNGAAYGAMAALPHLRNAGGGALILISSVEARVAVPLQAAYAASKHGVNALARVLRMELEAERSPVSVTEILPSSMNTPLFEKSRTRIGVQPRPLPFIYDPRLVVDAILHAAEHPTPEIIVGGSGNLFVQGERWAPRLTETTLAALGRALQRTREPKSDSAPDNLFEPLPDVLCNRTDGGFEKETRSTSAVTWLKTHPRARTLLTAGVMGSAALALLRRRARS